MTNETLPAREGRPYSYLSEVTGIAYLRVWRLYHGQGKPTDLELKRLRQALNGDGSGEPEDSTADLLGGDAA